MPALNFGGFLMKVLVIGGGGREHALTWKLAQSPLVTEIFCAPGNGGTAQIATNLTEIDANDLEALAAWAEQKQIGLTVVGPDAYLARGTVDLFQARGLKVYGPTQAAARLESSKVFAKEFMQRYGIPTAKFATFDTAEAAKEYIKALGAPLVVKADGLAAGKGVIVATELETALAAVDQIMTDRIFGESGARIVIEEYLEGEEVSLLALCDGKIALPLLPAQDHKRIGAGDTGLNTGGMGAYAPTTIYTKAVSQMVSEEILAPTLKAMAEEGTPFVGTLFLGLMLTKDGPRVIEYNVRFGDPETQAVLPLLESDLAELLLAAIEGRLDPTQVSWKPATTAVCVVAAASGYPGSFATGHQINGLGQIENSLIFHAGTKLDNNGSVVTAGGRVLNLVHLANDIASAIDGAYHDLQQVKFEGIYYRPDIGRRELMRDSKK